MSAKGAPFSSCVLGSSSRFYTLPFNADCPQLNFAQGRLRIPSGSLPGWEVVAAACRCENVLAGEDHACELFGWRQALQPSHMSVSPLRGVGLLRCASSRCQRPSVSPLRAAIPHAGSPPPSALAGAQGVAGLRPTCLAGSLANVAIKAAPSSQSRTAGSGRRCRRG